MKKTKIQFVFLLFLSSLGGFILTSCGPDDKPTIFLSQETKDYCLFQKGSYWVYESKSGEIDSIYTYRRDDHIGDMDNHFEETFGMRFTSSYKTDNTFRVGMGPFPGNSENPGGGGSVGEYWDKHYLSAWTTFYDIHIDSSGYVFKQPYETIQYRGHSDSIKVRENTFYSIREYKTLASNGLFAIKQVWWAKHIGKIKYIDRNDVEWSLIRYSVSQ